MLDLVLSEIYTRIFHLR